MHQKIVIMDYFASALEVVDMKTAVQMTHRFMKRFREEMKREEYVATYGIVERIGKEVNK